MDRDQTLKILKMVQEGFLTPEQGQRLIDELVNSAHDSKTQETPPRDEVPQSEPGSDLLKTVEEAGKTFSEGFDRLFGFAQQTVKEGLGLGPKEVQLRISDRETGNEKYQLTLPYKVFSALKPWLTQPPAIVLHPLQKVDYRALFESLESGQTGRVFEYIDSDRNERLEVWVQ